MTEKYVSIFICRSLRKQGIPRIQGNIFFFSCTCMLYVNRIQVPKIYRPSYCMVKHLIACTDLAIHNFVHLLLPTGATPCTLPVRRKSNYQRTISHFRKKRYRYLCMTVPAYGLCITVQAYMATIGMQLVSIAMNTLHI